MRILILILIGLVGCAQPEPLVIEEYYPEVPPPPAIEEPTPFPVVKKELKYKIKKIKKSHK